MEMGGGGCEVANERSNNDSKVVAFLSSLNHL